MDRFIDKFMDNFTIYIYMYTYMCVFQDKITDAFIDSVMGAVAEAKNAIDREHLANQLAKTTLSPKQQKHVLDDIYGGGGASSA